jgi:hypothetical protein
LTKDIVVWITARDGSMHATRPPIVAAGQPMLCGRSYERRDLRIESQGTLGHGPAGACAVCATGVTTAAAASVTAVPERKAPMWP